MHAGVHVDGVVAHRHSPALELAQQGRAVAAASRAMADRFERGGRLFAFGNGLAAADACDIAVEFLHPVIVGNRALPAMAFTSERGVLMGLAGAHGRVDVYARQLQRLAKPVDIALGLSATGACVDVLRALETAKAVGLATLALAGGGATTPIAESAAIDHLLLVSSDDPLIVKEAHVTTGHLLWELVQLFLEQADRPRSG